MNKKVLKKAMSAVLALAMSCSLFTVAYAAPTAGVNEVSIKTYSNGEEVDTVFVGETVDTVLAFKNMAFYDNYEIALVYDSSVIQLAPFAGSATIDNLYEFEGGSAGITVNEYAKTALKKILSSVLPEITTAGQPDIGVILSSREKKKANLVPVTEETPVLTMSFTAENAGTSGFRYASSDLDQLRINEESGWIDIGEGKDSVCLFPGLDVYTVINNFTVVEKPDKPENVRWGTGADDEFVVYWEAPSTGCRGYAVNVYINNVLEDTLDVDDTEINLLDFIKNKGVLGEYKVNVIAKGGTFDSEVSNDAIKQVNEILLELDPPSFVDGELSWNPLADADKYVIDIQKDYGDSPLDEPIVVTDPSLSSYDLSGYIGVGDYTITITPQSNSTIYRGVASTIRYTSGSTVSGKIKAVAYATDDLELNPAHVTTVTLIPENGGASIGPKACEADGSFSFTKVPNGKYTVRIERTSSVLRDLSEKLDLRSSVEWNLCEKDLSDVENGPKTIPLTILVGDINNTNNVDGNDIKALVPMFGATSDKTAYDSDVDMVAPGAINGQDAMVMIYNYYKGKLTYNGAQYKAEDHFPIYDDTENGGLYPTNFN